MGVEVYRSGGWFRAGRPPKGGSARCRSLSSLSAWSARPRSSATSWKGTRCVVSAGGAAGAAAVATAIGAVAAAFAVAVALLARGARAGFPAPCGRALCCIALFSEADPKSGTTRHRSAAPPRTAKTHRQRSQNKAGAPLVTRATDVDEKRTGRERARFVECGLELVRAPAAGAS